MVGCSADASASMRTHALSSQVLFLQQVMPLSPALTNTDAREAAQLSQHYITHSLCREGREP